MHTSHKLSLFEAFLININIMLGSGIFINTVILSAQAGAASPLVYLCVGILFFPLIYTIAALMKLHKGGTFYDFGKSLNPFMGFVSSWSYFIAKMASSFLSMHVFVTLMQQIFPSLGTLPALYCDLIVIGLFVLLNNYNLKIGSSIQFYFIILKIIPLTFALLSGIFLFKISAFGMSAFHWQGVPLSFPLVIFAFSGFEASCSLSKNIKNAEKNGPRALFASYSCVLFLVVLYQTVFYGSIGLLLAKMTHFTQAFPALGSALALPVKVQNIFMYIIHIGIASSALGASYGIMYSNAWNLYALAEHRHIPYSSLFTRLNNYGIPFNCILFEGFLASMYCLVTQGNQVLLQQISALGSTIAYTISVLACIALVRDKKIPSSPYIFLALFSCSLFVVSLLYAYTQKGAYSLVFFGSLFLLGSVHYWLSRSNTE